jgi:hypothetical protein
MNPIKKAFGYYFKKWWRPIIFVIITFILNFLALFTEYRIIQNIFFSLFILTEIGLVISIIIQFKDKKWIRGIITILILPVTIYFYFFLSIILFLYAQSTPDKFADKLTIPDNLSIEKPLGDGFEIARPDSIININRKSPHLQVYNSFQPGLYEYDFWTGRIEHGTIYLKVFEITKNQPLSVDRLRESSSLRVYNPSDSIMRFGTSNTFTIYEGDWGKPYAARFELWFKPDSSDNEIKIIEKNYIIEGWMR